MKQTHKKSRENERFEILMSVNLIKFSEKIIFFLVLILIAIVACAIALPDEEIVEIAAANHEGIQEIEEAQFHPMMNPMMMNPGMGMMGGMNSMMGHGMGQNYGPSIDYSMSCSNSCGCAQVIIKFQCRIRSNKK
jgi:hypothetical protein